MICKGYMKIDLAAKINKPISPRGKDRLVCRLEKCLRYLGRDILLGVSLRTGVGRMIFPYQIDRLRK